MLKIRDKFESYVILDTTKTGLMNIIHNMRFESYVILDTTKTQIAHELHQY